MPTFFSRVSIFAVSVFFAAGCAAPFGVATPTPLPSPTPPPVAPPQVEIATPPSPSQEPLKQAPIEAAKPATPIKKQQPTSSAPKPTIANVSIANFTFGPQVLAIKTGAAVVWTNQDRVPHTIVSDNATILDSSQLSTSQSFKHVFTSPGTYTYHCGIHPYMTGTIVVSPCTAADMPSAECGKKSDL